MNKPCDEFIASFVGVETDPHRKGGQEENGGTFVVSIEGKEIEIAGAAGHGETVVFCIRPENVILSTSATRETTSARNVFPGKDREDHSFRVLSEDRA